MSNLEAIFALQLRAHKITGWQREYRFAAQHVGTGKGLRERLARTYLQDWRFDFCHPEIMLAVEVEGGGWAGGRHTRGAGFAGDLRKYSAAMRLGWTIYRCDGAMIADGEAISVIVAIIKRRAAEASVMGMRLAAVGE